MPLFLSFFVLLIGFSKEGTLFLFPDASFNGFAFSALPVVILFSAISAFLYYMGSITSLIYTIETKQKLFTAWAPYVWPIKTLMLIGILLMLLQAFSTLFKDIANVREKKI